jgi:hypothetical protein
VAKGIEYRFDECSQTVSCFVVTIIHALIPVQPYVYNTTSQVMVSYDDATSFGKIYSLSSGIMISLTTAISRERSLYPRHAAKGICLMADWR